MTFFKFRDILRAFTLPAVLLTSSRLLSSPLCETLQTWQPLVRSLLFTEVLERFRSRSSFRDDLESFRNFKCHVESFLGLKQKAIELGVNCFDLKLECMLCPIH